MAETETWKGMVNGKITNLTEEDKERIKNISSNKTISIEDRISALEEVIADIALSMMEE